LKLEVIIYLKDRDDKISQIQQISETV